MKTLYLNRHAKSSWAKIGEKDFSRTLNDRGLKNAPEMGKRLKKRKILIEQIVSSPANRAITTAQLMANEIDYDIKKIKINEQIYGATLNNLMEVIRQLDNSKNNIILFGHNPGFTLLANYLCNCNIINVPTCGIVAIFFKESDWKNIKAKSGELNFFDYPKNEV